MQVGNWIAGIIVGLIGLIGLFLASGAVDIGIYIFGLLLFTTAALFNFWLVKRTFDKAERH